MQSWGAFDSQHACRTSCLCCRDLFAWDAATCLVGKSVAVQTQWMLSYANIDLHRAGHPMDAMMLHVTVHGQKHHFYSHTAKERNKQHPKVWQQHPKYCFQIADEFRKLPYLNGWWQVSGQFILDIDHQNVYFHLM